jgi:hypothetical protein
MSTVKGVLVAFSTFELVINLHKLVRQARGGVGL